MTVSADLAALVEAERQQRKAHSRLAAAAIAFHDSSSEYVRKKNRAQLEAAAAAYAGKVSAWRNAEYSYRSNTEAQWKP